ncbi:MAG: hypothetical protein K0S01_2435 [Herbinix sp.]|jgi:hypothetical protein|nr:hypothetical protein [Herbinix sp.]
MIIEWMLNLGLVIFDAIFALLGVLPDLSPQIVTVVDYVFDFMFDGVSLAAVFVDFSLVKIMIPLVIGVLNLDRIIKTAMFIIKKIPIVDIK